MAPIARKCSTLPATTTAGTMPAAGAGERAKVKGIAHAETLLNMVRLHGGQHI